MRSKRGLNPKLSAAPSEQPAVAERNDGQRPPADEAPPVYIRGWKNCCAMVGMSRVPLWRRVRAGTFPAPAMFGGQPLWKRADIDAYLASLPKVDYAAADLRREA